MIYISTGGFSSKSFLEVSKLFKKDIIKGLELSGGAYTKKVKKDLDEVSKKFKVALHNYFPVPKEPFVFNLASNNDKIVRESIEHAKRAIDLTSYCDGEYFSFHAGYLLDPHVSELGNSIKKRKMNCRQLGLEQFIKNVNILSEFAKSRGVTLLIENNVISAKNFLEFGCDPLLMTDASETKHIFDNVADNVKLLIDVAHLKVSANTLSFDPIDYLLEFKDITAAYHISDNNGLEDSNQPFKKNSWFIDYIRKDLDYYSLEVYTSDIEVLESQYSLLTEILR